MDAELAQPLEGCWRLFPHGVAQSNETNRTLIVADEEQSLALILKTLDTPIVAPEADLHVLFEIVPAADNDAPSLDVRGHTVGDKVVHLAVGDVLEITLLGRFHYGFRYRMAGVLLDRSYQRQQILLNLE